MRDYYTYRFDPVVPIEDLEASLLLAVLSTECIHGTVDVRLDASHFLDTERRLCVIDAETEVGRDLNRLFLGFVRHEFGDDAFEVSRRDQTIERQACA